MVDLIACLSARIIRGEGLHPSLPPVDSGRGLVLSFPAAEREKSSPSGCHTFLTAENTDPASLRRTGGVTSERVFLSQTLPLTFFRDVLKDTGIRMLANP